MVAGAIAGGGIGSIPMSTIGAGAGAIAGSITGAGANAYEGVVIGDLQEEIHTAAESGKPLIIKSPDNQDTFGVFVDGNNDGNGTLVNSLFALFIINVMTFSTTGSLLLPVGG